MNDAICADTEARKGLQGNDCTETLSGCRRQTLQRHRQGEADTLFLVSCIPLETHFAASNQILASEPNTPEYSGTLSLVGVIRSGQVEILYSSLVKSVTLASLRTVACLPSRK